MARQKARRFLNPAGLRRAQYEKFFDAITEFAPEVWSQFWSECWPPVRDCQQGWEPIAARKAADAWLRRVRLTGPDGAPPEWLLVNLEVALVTRADVLRLFGKDPGEQFFVFAGVGRVNWTELQDVLPAAVRLRFEDLLEPARGLEAERRRILERFRRWLNRRIAELAARARDEAPGEETEAAAMRLWVCRWLGREPLADAARREQIDLRRAQALVAWASEALGLRLPVNRGRPKKRN